MASRIAGFPIHSVFSTRFSTRDAHEFIAFDWLIVLEIRSVAQNHSMLSKKKSSEDWSIRTEREHISFECKKKTQEKIDFFERNGVKWNVERMRKPYRSWKMNDSIIERWSFSSHARFSDDKNQMIRINKWMRSIRWWMSPSTSLNPLRSEKTAKRTSNQCSMPLQKVRLLVAGKESSVPVQLRGTSCKCTFEMPDRMTNRPEMSWYDGQRCVCVCEFQGMDGRGDSTCHPLKYNLFLFYWIDYF